MKSEYMVTAICFIIVSNSETLNVAQMKLQLYFDIWDIFKLTVRLPDEQSF